MLSVAAGLAASTAVGSPALPTSAVAAQIVEVDRLLNQAIVAHDHEAAKAFYDDDFILTVSGGGSKRKADMLADIRNPAVNLTVCETTDVDVRVRGNTAVLTGVLQQTGTVNGRALNVRLNVTDTWVAIDGKWLLLAGHASPAKTQVPAAS